MCKSEKYPSTNLANLQIKNLRKVNGISLLGYTSQFINKCNFFDEKLVSTDSKKIIDETKKLKLTK